ncbi:MAG TPA: diguanylate cyclase, partial [Thermoanaerobaculia bacterium]|nr:diguanylate cyclase [Thermoanaerobaculia bacterium]
TSPVRDARSSAAWERISDTALVEEATERVRRRPEDQRFDPLVVVGPDLSYRGVLPIDALLFELSRLKVEFALQSNPVTRLPGRPFFEPVIAQRLELQEPFVVGRLNLLRFKAFNDRYGFLRGDDLLVRVASLLRGEIGPLPGAIVAHFSNDDFAYIAPMENAEENARRLLAKFEEIVREAHDADDVSGAGFVVTDRRGEPRTLPLVGLAIGLVPWSGEDGVGLRALLQTAESTLQGARSSGASKVLLNRRDLVTAARISAEHPVIVPREGPPPRDA